MARVELRSAGTRWRWTWVALPSLVFGACHAEDQAPRRPSASQLAATNRCDVRSAGSRWVSHVRSYRLSGQYGRRKDQLLVDLWGIASTPRGAVLVYDAGRTHVLELDDALRLVHVVGREGQGPGEFAYQRVTHGNWIAAEDTTFVVLNLRALAVFNTDGQFERDLTRAPPFPVGIARIAAWSGGLLYGRDVLIRHEGTRSMETHRIDGAGTDSLLRNDPMPTLPRWQGHPVRGAFVDQGEPLRAAHEGCVFLSDGAGDWVLRVDVASNRADTLRLPPRGIPKRTEEDKQYMETLRRRGAIVGIVVGSAQVRPTARVKWTDMIVDPDGFVWIQPWRPRHMRSEPETVFVVNPSTGATDSLVVGGFPQAFLPDASFVAIAYDSAQGASVVQKYTLEPNGG